MSKPSPPHARRPPKPPSRQATASPNLRRRSNASQPNSPNSANNLNRFAFSRAGLSRANQKRARFYPDPFSIRSRESLEVGIDFGPVNADLHPDHLLDGGVGV